jgi:hypothetical protein
MNSPEPSRRAVLRARQEICGRHLSALVEPALDTLEFGEIPLTLDDLGARQLLLSPWPCMVAASSGWLTQRTTRRPAWARGKKHGFPAALRPSTERVGLPAALPPSSAAHDLAFG